MKTALLILTLVFCVDRRWDTDRCFSTPERAASYCDFDEWCQGLYPKEDSRNV